MVPQVTVIVPLYNKAATVERTLSSIQAQTLADFEAIIVNDGSTDKSLPVAKAFVERSGDKRFRIIDQPNQGPGAARNRGLIEAQSEVAAFLDADDEWLPHYLAVGVAGLAAAGEEVALYTQAWIDEPGGTSAVPGLLRQGLKNGAVKLSTGTTPQYLVALMVFLWPCTTMVRRRLAMEYGGFREDRCLYAEDVHLWLKICLNHAAILDLRESARFQHAASNLSANHTKARPIEPFLEDPDDIKRYCPKELEQLLADFFCIRAMKTACMLAYWGHWRAARDLRRRFLTPRANSLPWFYPSLLAATPFGELAGKVVRSFR